MGLGKRLARASRDRELAAMVKANKRYARRLRKESTSGAVGRIRADIKPRDARNIKAQPTSPWD